MANFCFNCGEKVNPEWKVCPECGAPLIQASPKTVVNETQPYVPPQPPQQLFKQEPQIKKPKADLLKIASHLVPFLGGLLILIAFFTPAAWFHRNVMGFDVEYDYIWIFGLDLYYWWETGLTVHFIPNMVGGIPNILIWVCSILLICGSISVMVVSRMIKRRKMHSDNLILGILIIVIMAVTILWMIIMELFLSILWVSNRFWGTTFPGFGIIGTFLGIVVILIGIGLNTKYKKRVS